MCVYEPVTKNESLLVYACAIVCMCYGIYVQYCLFSSPDSFLILFLFATLKNWYTLQLKRRCSNALTHVRTRTHTHTHTQQRCGHVMTSSCPPVLTHSCDVDYY